MLPAAMIIIGLDVEGENKIPQLYRCDPAGYYVGYKATSAGQKEQEANNFLEKRYKADPNPQLSYDDTVQLALACLQNVLGSDLKAQDIEVRGLLCPTLARLARRQVVRPALFDQPRFALLRGVGDCPQACVVRHDNLKFSRLGNDEIEAQLTALAERDDDIAVRD
jgi:hypothetical protein